MTIETCELQPEECWQISQHLPQQQHGARYLGKKAGVVVVVVVSFGNGGCSLDARRSFRQRWPVRRWWGVRHLFVQVQDEYPTERAQARL